MVTNNNSGDTSHEPSLTPSQLRMLKTVVIITGVFLIMGFVGLASVLVYKISTLNKGQSANQAVEAAHSKVIIPKEAVIKSISHAPGTLALHISDNGTQEIRIYNTKTGALLNKVQIQQE